MNIQAIQNFITGKKTYAVAITSLIAVILGWANHQIGNQAALDQAVGLILAMTIRHGVTTSAVKAANTPQKQPSNSDDGITVTLVPMEAKKK